MLIIVFATFRDLEPCLHRARVTFSHCIFYVHTHTKKRKLTKSSLDKTEFQHAKNECTEFHRFLEINMHKRNMPKFRKNKKKRKHGNQFIYESYLEGKSVLNVDIQNIFVSIIIVSGTELYEQHIGTYKVVQVLRSIKKRDKRRQNYKQNSTSFVCYLFAPFFFLRCVVTGLRRNVFLRGGFKFQMMVMVVMMIIIWFESNVSRSKIEDTFTFISAILTLYLVNVLLFEEHTAKSIYHGFIMACYFSPVLGAMIADSFLGKFRLVISLFFPRSCNINVIPDTTQLPLMRAL